VYGVDDPDSAARAAGQLLGGLRASHHLERRVSRAVHERGPLILMLILAGVFAATVLSALGITAWGSSEARTMMNGLLPVLLPSELTLLTAATGYYFFLGNRSPGRPGAGRRRRPPRPPIPK